MSDKSKTSEDLVLDVAMQSLDATRQRWNTINNLHHSLLSIALSFTLMVPVIARSLNLCLQDNVVKYILAAGVASCITCLIARLRWKQGLVSPRELYRNLDENMTPNDMKRRIIWDAGTAFDLTTASIDKKWRTAVIATALLASEVLAVAWWLAGIR